MMKVSILLLIILCFSCKDNASKDAEPLENNKGCNLQNSVHSNQLFGYLMNIDEVNPPHHKYKTTVDSTFSFIRNNKEHEIKISSNNDNLKVYYRKQQYNIQFDKHFKYEFIGIQQKHQKNISFVFNIIFSNDCRFYIDVDFDEKTNKFKNTITQWDFVNGR